MLWTRRGYEATFRSTQGEQTQKDNANGLGTLDWDRWLRRAYPARIAAGHSATQVNPIGIPMPQAAWSPPMPMYSRPATPAVKPISMPETVPTACGAASCALTIWRGDCGRGSCHAPATLVAASGESLTCSSADRMPSIPGLTQCGTTVLQRMTPTGSMTNSARALVPSSAGKTP